MEEADLPELRSIFFCEFDPIVGPKITFQVPEGSVKHELFEATHEYFIAKPALCGRLISVVACGWRVLGWPMLVEGARYVRNYVLFNVCLVLPDDLPAHRAAAYEPLVRKLAASLRALEVESALLSGADKGRLQPLLAAILDGLQRRAHCSIAVDEANTINLKLFPARPPPPLVHQHDVPVLVREVGRQAMAEWDLALVQLVPFIDGVRHVRAIAAAAQLPLPLVAHACRHLVWTGSVRLIDAFQYTNVYVPTARIGRLRQSGPLQQRCMQYVGVASAEHALQLYGSLRHSDSVEQFCHTHLADAAIDPRRLITFGLLNGLIRRVHKYPLNLSPASQQEAGEAGRQLDGTASLDELRCAGRWLDDAALTSPATPSAGRTSIFSK